jgi:hypothetical protein
MNVKKIKEGVASVKTKEEKPPVKTKKMTKPRGRRAASSEAEPVRGDLRVGHFGGPSGPPWHGPCPVCLSGARSALTCFWVLSGDSPVCLRGPLGLSPTVAPEHLWVCH